MSVPGVVGGNAGKPVPDILGSFQQKKKKNNNLVGIERSLFWFVCLFQT